MLPTRILTNTPMDFIFSDDIRLSLETNAPDRSLSGDNEGKKSVPRTLPLSIRQQIDDLIQDLQNLDVRQDHDELSLAPLAITIISPMEHTLCSWAGQWRLHIYKTAKSYYGQSAISCFVQAYMEQVGYYPVGG